MAESLKVAFVGADNSGKTTLAEHYRNRKVEGLEVVANAATDFVRENPNAGDPRSYRNQRLIQSLAMNREKDAHKSHASRIVCDGSVLDAVAILYGQSDLRGAHTLYGRAYKWRKSYAGIFLLDPNDIPDQPEITWKVQGGYLRMFAERKIPYTLLKGTVEERAAQVDRLLGL